MKILNTKSLFLAMVLCTIFSVKATEGTVDQAPGAAPVDAPRVGDPTPAQGAEPEQGGDKNIQNDEQNPENLDGQTLPKVTGGDNKEQGGDKNIQNDEQNPENLDGQTLPKVTVEDNKEQGGDKNIQNDEQNPENLDGQTLPKVTVEDNKEEKPKPTEAPMDSDNSINLEYKKDAEILKNLLKELESKY